MTLTALIAAAQAAVTEHGDMDVIARRPVTGGGLRRVEDYEVTGTTLDEPVKPWEGGERVFVVEVGEI